MFQISLVFLCHKYLFQCIKIYSTLAIYFQLKSFRPDLYRPDRDR